MHSSSLATPQQSTYDQLKTYNAWTKAKSTIENQLNQSSQGFQQCLSISTMTLDSLPKEGTEK